MIRNSPYFWPVISLMLSCAVLAALIYALVDHYQEVRNNLPPKQEYVTTLVDGAYVSVFTPKNLTDVECVLVHGSGIWCKESKQ